MSRNQFENNGHISEDDLDARIHVMLPPLVEGHHYGFLKLSDGRTAVVVEEGDESQVRDQFGRKYAGQ